MNHSAVYKPPLGARPHTGSPPASRHASASHFSLLVLDATYDTETCELCEVISTDMISVLPQTLAVKHYYATSLKPMSPIVIDVSVLWSVCLSCLCIELKQQNISTISLHTTAPSLSDMWLTLVNSFLPKFYPKVAHPLQWGGLLLYFKIIPLHGGQNHQI